MISRDGNNLMARTGVRLKKKRDPLRHQILPEIVDLLVMQRSNLKQVEIGHMKLVPIYPESLTSTQKN